MDFVFLLACDNAMERDGPLLAMPTAVGDLSAIGIIAATILAHMIRARRPGFSDQLLLLILGALIPAVGGAVAGFRFQVTPFTVLSVPLLLVAIAHFRQVARHERERFLRAKQRDEQLVREREAMKRRRAAQAAEAQALAAPRTPEQLPHAVLERV